MKLNEPNIIIELSDTKIILFVVSFDEKKNFKVLKKIFLESLGIQNGRVFDMQALSKLLKKEGLDDSWIEKFLENNSIDSKE